MSSQNLFDESLLCASRDLEWLHFLSNKNTPFETFAMMSDLARTYNNVTTNPTVKINRMNVLIN